jgi:hypothetical protein
VRILEELLLCIIQLVRISPNPFSSFLTLRRLLGGLPFFVLNPQFNAPIGAFKLLPERPCHHADWILPPPPFSLTFSSPHPLCPHVFCINVQFTAGLALSTSLSPLKPSSRLWNGTLRLLVRISVHADVFRNKSPKSAFTVRSVPHCSTNDGLAVILGSLWLPMYIYISYIYIYTNVTPFMGRLFKIANLGK